MSLIYNASALKLLKENAKRHDNVEMFKYDVHPRVHHIDDIVEKIYEELTALDAALGGANTALVGTYTNKYIPRWNATTNTLESGSITDDGVNSVGIGALPNTGYTLRVVSSLTSPLSVLRVEGIGSPDRTGDYTIQSNYILMSSATAKITGVLYGTKNELYTLNTLTLPSESIGSYNTVTHYETTDALAKAVGFSSLVETGPNADITEGICYEIKQPDSYGNIFTWYGLKSEGSDNNNTNYHIYLSPHTDGTKWGIYQEGVNDKNYFGAQLQLNHTSGSAGQFLKSADTAGNAVWSAISNSDVTGAVQISSTPANNQVAVWTNATTLEGDANFTWNGSTLEVANADHYSRVHPNYFLQLNESDDANLLLYTKSLGTSVGSEIVFGRWNDVAGSESPLLNSQLIAAQRIMGSYDTANPTNITTGALIEVRAAENWSTTAQGVYYTIDTNAIGEITPTERFAIQSDGNVKISSNLLYSKQVYQTGGVYNAGNTGSSLALNFDNGNIQECTMNAASITIANPTNAKDGSAITICFIQDATASRTIASWGSNWNWGDAGAPDFSGGTAAGDKFYVTVIVNGTELDAIYSGVKH